jgi:hypothetical protein
MPSKDDHLEAAKLAKIVGSHLNMIDKFSLERSNVPANRIDINQFIAKVVDPNKQFGNASGYVPEALVQKMVPDTSVYSKPPDLIQMPPAVQNVAPAPVQPVVQASSIPTEEVQTLVQNASNPKVNIQTSSSLEQSFEKIANSLEKLVDFYVESNTLKANKKKQVLND